MIARNDKAAVVLFFFRVSAMDILETNNETESCINPVVGYNIADENFTAVNTLQDVTEKSNVNVSGLWIFPFPLPRKNTLINSILKYFFSCSYTKYTYTSYSQTKYQSAQPAHLGFIIVEYWPVNNYIHSWCGNSGVSNLLLEYI